MIHSRCRRQQPLHSMYSGSVGDSAAIGASTRPILAGSRSLAAAMVEEMEPVTGFRYDHVFKVVLVGESGVGKTSLAQRFSTDAFRPEAPSTIGVDFSVRVVQVGGKRIKMQLWDTSGQESMRCIIPNYFRFAEAIVVVYDSTDLKSFLKLPEWLTTIESHREPNALVFIMGTKCDMDKTRAVSPKMAKDFAKSSKLPAFETSALRGDGVEDAFTSVVKALEKHLGMSHARSSLVLRGTGGGGGGASPSRRSCC